MVTPHAVSGLNCREIVAHMTGAITVNFNHLLNLALEGQPVPPSGFNLFQRNADEVKKRKTLPIDRVINEFQIEQPEIITKI